jgi:hypothetical protein
VKGAVELATLVGVLFGIAGRVDWPAAWLIILLFTGHMVLSGWLLFRHDPELLEERLTTATNVPHWDRLIARGNRILPPTFVATAALDAGRFGPRLSGICEARSRAPRTRPVVTIGCTTRTTDG